MDNREKHLAVDSFPATKRLDSSSVSMKIQAGEKLSFEKSVSGRVGVSTIRKDKFSDLEIDIPQSMLRDSELSLCELSEPEVVRHYTRLSKLNASLEEHIYPLGSCTMKYNPRLNEQMVRLDGFSNLHPHTPSEGAQGALELMYELSSLLLTITGQSGIALSPGAGAHGEMAGMMMIREALFRDNSTKDVVLIPDSAHGTNPATCSVVGLKTRSIRTGERGVIEVRDLMQAMSDDVCAIMITNPNTLGLYERNIEQIVRIISDNGGYVYMDGANFNALLSRARPGDIGVDAMHINLHKTFSQPHGGGGPGAGPVVVSERLKQYLPNPRVIKSYSGFSFENGENSFGRVREFFGNFGVFVRAYAYILRLGLEGLKLVTDGAVLNANYIRKRLEGYFHLPFSEPSLHEVVFSDKIQLENNVSALDIAKRLIDYGMHPPTMYFPLVVKGALMIEPTESESRQSLDCFCDSMIAISEEAKLRPEIFKMAPYTSPCGRLDEVRASRNPVLSLK